VSETLSRAVGALPTTTPEAAGFSSEKLEAIAAHFEAEIARGEIPNAAYALARHGQVVWRGHLGYADLASKRPVAEDSIYRLLSLTKAISGVALMSLVEDGRVDLADPVARYIPSFAQMQVWTPTGLVPAARPITLFDLVTHTSGLTSGFMPGPVPDLYLELGLQEGTLEAQSQTLADYVDRLASRPLLVQPGTEFNYSEGLAVVGRVVEVMTGRRYADYLQDRVFGPLGMTDCGFFTPAEQLHRFVTLYGWREGGGLYEYSAMDFPKPSAPPMRIMQVERRPGMDAGGAGTVGTVDDVLRFAMMLAGGGALGGVRILKPETVKRLSTGVVRAIVGDEALVKVPFDVRGRGMDMGMSVYVITDSALSDSACTPGSFGFGGSAGTRFWSDPATGIAGVFFTQRMSCPPEPFAAFQRLVYGAFSG
jgi:CubicO group peptidase (beta-lactamase class C family)